MAQITAGVDFSWGTGTSSDTKPNSWTHIPDITEIPEVGGEAETYESTSLDNKEYKTYISGLKDLGGSLGLTANDTPEFRTAWKAFVTASKGENGAWAAITIPAPINERMVFKAEATPLGFGGASINGILTTTAYVTPISEPEWVTVE
jgi:hypothetical protein|nr:MAG TPA: tail tube protein [Bacteriophage sp.]